MVNLHPLTPHIMPSYTSINGERTATTDSVTSQDTSVSSALETFVIIALYKSTFTIPYHTTEGQPGTQKRAALYQN